MMLSSTRINAFDLENTALVTENYLHSYDNISEILVTDNGFKNLGKSYPSYPFVIRNFMYQGGHSNTWDFMYFREKLKGKKLPLKDFQTDGSIVQLSQKAEEYIDQILAYERNLKEPGDLSVPRPAYCHDIPVFNIEKSLTRDVEHIPDSLFPSWYHKYWWQYSQFFMSPSGSVTPLHYDTLLTHNIFFQAYGEKEFILIDRSDAGFCYRKDWRWFDVDPSNVDLKKFPEFAKARVKKVVLKQGDLLYMPPGMLHHVTTLSASISFNVDFHTNESVVKSFLSLFDGMPRKTVFYNWLVFLGLVGKVPSKYIFKYYKSYLNYIS